MEEKKQFTEEELKSIQQFQQDYQNKIVQFGQIELEKIYLKQRENSINELEKIAKDEFVKLQEKEQVFVKSLNDKYGPGTVNPQSGEFTPAPQVQQTAPAVS